MSETETESESESESVSESVTESVSVSYLKRIESDSDSDSVSGTKMRYARGLFSLTKADPVKHFLLGLFKNYSKARLDALF